MELTPDQIRVLHLLTLDELEFTMRKLRYLSERVDTTEMPSQTRAMLSAEFASKERELQHKKSRLIDCLKKFESDTYGTCDFCGTHISFARLVDRMEEKLCSKCEVASTVKR